MSENLIIIGGGKGVRMAEYMPGIPKLLLPLDNEQTVLSRLIKQTHASSVYLALNSDSKKITDELSPPSVNFQISIEEEPLGTFGALKLLAQRYSSVLPEKITVILGDLVCNEYQKYQVNLMKELTKRDGNWFFFTKNNHPHDSDRIDLEDNRRIKALYKKTETSPKFFVNKTVSGLYLLNLKDVLQTDLDRGDIVMDFLPTLISQQNAFATELLCNLNDIGTPDRYKALIKSGSYSVKRKYLLMDLDGTLIVDRGSSPTAYEITPTLNPVAVNLLKRCNKNRVKVIIITNQGDIAKGFLSKPQFENEIRSIEDQLWQAGVWFDDLFYCPHHPERGYEGEIIDLKIECECRKPKSGMWQKAKEKWSISTDNAVFVGDTHFDEGFCRAANLKYYDINSIQGQLEELDKFIGES
ncbi:hypothetical protein DID78_01285 [Candidatus Marinamargulisbacteria bacterium SCGC AG-343-D04]|nr:hypothetical protein DID78_01285 [Candidatus Marinamargulisbacteria bacterium SCGC AG-343-D04]